MYFFLKLIIYCQIYATVHSWKHFLLGRSTGGSVGIPLHSKFDKNEISQPMMNMFKQKLDHFDATNEKTWEQRYFVTNQFHDDLKGPVFLMIGGEGPIDPRWMVKGAWVEYAKICKALCFALEHRFYGESYPFTETTVSNLKYLSSKQALGDLANFIDTMNQRYNLRPNTKWIVFGGSYSGSLAAWMRLKYPHLVYGAVSSSGPLLAKLDFQDYYRVMVEAIHEKTGSDHCIEELKEAQKQVALLISMDAQIIEKTFKLCKPLRESKPVDLKVFFNNIADYIADVVQYNEDNRFTLNSTYLNVTINSVCDLLTVQKESPYAKLGRFARLMLERYEQDCFDYSYDSMINSLRSQNMSKGGTREWFYQTCTEFGFYQTSTGVPDLFAYNFDVDFFVKQCQDVFGSQFNETFILSKVHETNVYYGGFDVSATRVLYVQGSIDPWHALGLNATRDPSSPVIYIKGTAHCANVYPSRDTDPYALKTSRATILRQLTKWTL